MAEKTTHKGRRAKIDEDNDVFLSFINKRKRNNKKKLTEIEELEKRDQSTLKPEQQAKIKGKPELFKQNAYWHEIKDLYYQALKTNQEEGGKKQLVPKEAGKEQEKAPVQQETKVHKEETQAKPRADVVRPIVGLFHVNEFFGNSATREEFDKGYMNMSGSLGLTTFPDLKAMNEFSNKVFKTCGAGTTSGDGLDKAVHHLQKYVDGSDEKAAGDKSYAYISDVVGKLVASEFFRGHKVTHHHQEEHKKTEHKQVEHKHATTEHKHATTEHKHAPVEHKQVEHKPVEHKPVEHKHAPVEHKHVEQTKKHESPKKTQPEEPKKKEDSPLKTKKETHHKEDTRAPQVDTEEWDKFEDDEEEEVERKVYTKKSEPKKTDDGFVEVTAKYLDKKKGPDTGRGGRRGGRRGGDRGGERGGYRGGENRGEYKGGEKGEYRGGESRGGDRGEYRGGESRGGDRGEYKGGEYKGGEKGEYRGGESRGGDKPYRERREGDKEYVPRQRRGDYQGGHGDYQGNRRRGGQEYVPKQVGAPQTPTTTTTTTTTTQQ